MDSFNSAQLGEVAKLTVIGSAFVGVGTLLNSYVPAFHAPVTWVERALHQSGHFLSNNPRTSMIFRDNPLTNSKTMTQFLAVNIVESALIGGVLVGGGAVLKHMGIKASDIERFLATNRSEPSRS